MADNGKELVEKRKAVAHNMSTEALGMLVRSQIRTVNQYRRLSQRGNRTAKSETSDIESLLQVYMAEVRERSKQGDELAATLEAIYGSVQHALELGEDSI